MHTHSQEHTAPNRPSSPPWWGGPVLRSLALGAALGLALALPLSVQAETFHCGAGDVQCLIDAINQANANGDKNTIRLEAGTYPLTAVDNVPPGEFGGNGLPVITSILIIRGQEAETTIIERAAGAPEFRLLHVAMAGTLTLQGLTLRGGLVSVGPGPGSPRGGGALYNQGTVTLRHCTLTENAVVGSGAGILNQGTLTLRDSLLRDNGALAFGSGGGLANAGGLVTITRVTFEGNGALDEFGGGLANGGTMTIAHTTFVSNLSGISGGGLTNGGTLTITDSTFVSNGAIVAGGGLVNFGTLVISNTTFNDNRANLFGGGGLANFDFGTLTLINSTIAGNSTFVTGGGGLTNLDSGTVRVANTILAGNSRFVGPPSMRTPVPDECHGAVTSLGHNLIGDPTDCTITLQASDLTGDPGLATYRDNGRPGNGHFPLLKTSQAIDAGNKAVCPRTDQLGRRRLGPCDIGAIEFRERDDRQHDEEDEHDAEDEEDEEDVG
jgi:hypothetical protein